MQAPRLLQRGRKLLNARGLRRTLRIEINISTTGARVPLDPGGMRGAGRSAVRGAETGPPTGGNVQGVGAGKSKKTVLRFKTNVLTWQADVRYA